MAGESLLSLLKALMNEIKCWEIKKCPSEVYKNCPAYLSADLPCWEIKGLPLSSLEVKSCSICPVFIKYHDKNIMSKSELLRYNRQLIMENWGEEKQKKLKKATVFIAGAGGLCGTVSIYLAEAGIGRLIICDNDTVDITNLNRQILHNDTRIGENKAISAKKTLEKLNPHVEVISVTERITEENISEFTGESEIIVDCLDNYQTRFVLNKYAVQNRIPLVYGAIYGLEGQLSFIHHPETFCLACLYSEGPPKEIFPVVGATPAVIGSLQVLEVLKYLTGIGENLKGKLLVFNGLNQEFRKLLINKNPICPVCSSK